jgi:hypothetical protein
MKYALTLRSAVEATSPSAVPFAASASAAAIILFSTMRARTRSRASFARSGRLSAAE